MRWLIDEMLPPRTAELLRELGHDAVAVSELAMRAAADDELFERAVAEERLLVTENFRDHEAILKRRQAYGQTCVPLVFVRRSRFPQGGALAHHLAKHLDTWAADNPAPIAGISWLSRRAE